MNRNCRRFYCLWWPRQHQEPELLKPNPLRGKVYPSKKQKKRLQIELLEIQPHVFMFWACINSLIMLRMSLNLIKRRVRSPAYFLCFKISGNSVKTPESQIRHKTLLGQWNHPKVNLALRLDFNGYVNSLNLQLSQLILNIIFTSNSFFCVKEIIHNPFKMKLIWQAFIELINVTPWGKGE